MFAREVADRSGTIVDFCAQSGESIPADDNQFDSAVITWTMCTIPNPHNAMMEIKRVLKPGGRVYFAEHGLSPDVKVAKWQHRINRLWKPLAGGCNLNRQPDGLLIEAGLTIDHMECGYIQGLKLQLIPTKGSHRPSVPHYVIFVSRHHCSKSKVEESSVQATTYLG